MHIEHLTVLRKKALALVSGRRVTRLVKNLVK